MTRAIVIGGALFCGCARGEPPTAPASEPARAGAVDGAEAGRASAGGPEGADAAPADGVEPGPPGADGRCEPMPKVGEPCRAGDGYCVLSWGEPGGYSEALWCRDGRWQLEQERNLP